MTKNIEILTFSIEFFKDEETQTVTFSMPVDRDVYDDPKEAAIDHVTSKIDLIQRDAEIPGFLPRFKTFRVIRSHRPSDLEL